ncbi:MAG: M23 family metallopeptidase [Proteobacteria bacterium]|nr:M23 family metallopeptidase [Pseudomonadota bacterium]
MQKKAKRKNDRHFLITVSDKQGTQHFKLPKFVKPLLIGISLSLTLGLLVSNILVFSQHNELSQTKSQSDSLEDAFVKLSSKNSQLNQSLKLEHGEKELMSVVLTQMEEISGVNSGINSSIVDRLTTISNHFAAKELDFEELYGRVDLLEESIGLEDTESEKNSTALGERIELASLSVSQQKILHDSIPNGYPTANTGITSAFGKRIHPTTKQSSFHNGIDLKAARGTEIYATADGIIKDAGYNKLSGNRVVLSHNLGFQTRYAHLSEMTVKTGDVVQKGDLIGLSGNTGRSDGPHLHYEIRYLDKPHNPVDFINWEFGNQEIFTNVRGIQWQSLISLINKQISRPTLQLSQVAL